MKLNRGGFFGAKMDSLYNRLCTSTHSRKDRLGATNLPRMERAKDMPCFEPLEILYTGALFCSVVDLEVRMIQKFFDEEPKTMWVEQIHAILESMVKKLGRMQTWIKNVDGGYIIHREHIALSNNKQVLYSVTLNKELKIPSRPRFKLDSSEVKEFDDKLKKRFIRDIE